MGTFLVNFENRDINPERPPSKTSADVGSTRFPGAGTGPEGPCSGPSISVPAGVVCVLLAALSMPRHFPNRKRPYQRRSSVYQIDFLGALLLAVMTTHLTGVEEAANLHL
ncbi:hypothetical protein F4781DRAFT_434688 [Annulohypoxylon bovei var. microspora]|nr:hypothetical protein F4781DRAFT_434688 [Annulohypoxylon bovei var. microspora]